jgi:hypothetical protein
MACDGQSPTPRIPGTENAEPNARQQQRDSVFDDLPWFTVGHAFHQNEPERREADCGCRDEKQ